jgi:predicted dehydrogenase
MRIGIVGAENSHSAAIAKVINVERKIDGFSVDYIWGETAKFAKDAAEAGRIPNVVKRPTDMLGKIDAVIVDHRHAKHHLPAALPFLKKRLPAFIDKPFSYRAREGRRFLALAKKLKVPVTSFSVIPRQASFAELRKKLARIGKVLAGTSWGPCDLRSKYGGVFFYGIHQVEACLAAFGYDVDGVQVVRGANVSTGTLLYKSGLVVTMNLIREGSKGFGFAAVGDAGSFEHKHVGDENPYLSGIRAFTTMFDTGREPAEYTHERILRPVEVLEALERSVRTGKVEKVR